jgi:hypothetical protein
LGLTITVWDWWAGEMTIEGDRGRGVPLFSTGTTGMGGASPEIIVLACVGVGLWLSSMLAMLDVLILIPSSGLFDS